MPELPEVERARKYLCPYIGKTIIRAKAADDTIVFSKQNPKDVAKQVLGKKILDVKRHGKVFWLELENSYQLGFHFGMTGELKIKGKQLIEYRNSKSKADKSWPPRWYKMMIYVTKDQELIQKIDALNEDLQNPKEEGEETEWKEEENEKIDCFTFCDVRRLGRVWLSQDIMKEEPLSNHGFDVMNEMPPFETFLKEMKTKTCGIKSLLLDQSFSSGIGNWIADEVLYQARIHPLQNVKELDEDDIRRIYDALVEVITLAVSVNADADRFPEFWMFHYRWSKRNSGKGQTIMIPNVGKIEFIKAGGRTTAIVPALQKLKKKSGNQTKKEKVPPEDKDSTKALINSEIKQETDNLSTTKIKTRKSTRVTVKKELGSVTEEEQQENRKIPKEEEKRKNSAKGKRNVTAPEKPLPKKSKKEQVNVVKKEVELKKNKKVKKETLDVKPPNHSYSLRSRH